MNSLVGKVAMLALVTGAYGCSSLKTLDFYHASGNEWTAAHTTPDSVYVLMMRNLGESEALQPYYAAVSRKSKPKELSLQPLAASVYENLAEQDFLQTGVQAYFLSYTTGKPLKGILYTSYSHEYGNLEGIATDSNGYTYRYNLQDSVRLSRTTVLGDKFDKFFYFDRRNVKGDSITLYAKDAFAQVGLPYNPEMVEKDSVRVKNRPAITLVRKGNSLAYDTLDVDSIPIPLFIFMNPTNLFAKNYYKVDFIRIFFDRHTLDRPIPARRGIFRHTYYVSDSLNPQLATVSVSYALGKKRVRLDKTALPLALPPAHFPAGWYRPENHLSASGLKSLTPP